MARSKTKSNRSQPAPAEAIRKPKPRRQKGGCLFLGLGLAAVSLLSATGGAWLALSLSATPLMQSELTPEEASIFDGEELARTTLQMPELTRPVNILLLGTKVLTSDVDDLSPEQENLSYEALVNSRAGLSDTILLLRFDPQEDRLTLLHVPRDTRTYVDGIGTTKINEANEQGGPALAAEAIGELLGGATIDRYVRVNVQGIEKLIDALGGVTVYVPRDMKYTDLTQHLYIDLEEGERHLNGEQVLQFLRFRDELGDIGRIQRQQILMRALMEQTLKPVTLVRLPQVLASVREYIDTNLTVEELVALVGFGVEHVDNPQMLLLPGDFGNLEDYSGVSYWVPRQEEIDRMMAEYFDFGWYRDDREVTEAQFLTIAIQNGTEDESAADSLVEYLLAEGYDNIFESDDWTEPLQKTRIVAQQGDRESAWSLRKLLEVGEVRVESTGNLRSDITIQIGRDWLSRSRILDLERSSETFEESDEFESFE